MKQDELSPVVALRPVELLDLPTLYEFQLDDEANQMAATVPRNRDQFNAHWEWILHNSEVHVRAIVAQGVLVGAISCFTEADEKCVGYWLGKPYWGQGIATRALRLMLKEVVDRPLYARVALHNQGSLSVLKHCGFQIIGQERGEASDRYVEGELVILCLDSDEQ